MFFRRHNCYSVRMGTGSGCLCQQARSLRDITFAEMSDDRDKPNRDSGIKIFPFSCLFFSFLGFQFTTQIKVLPTVFIRDKLKDVYATHPPMCLVQRHSLRIINETEPEQIRSRPDLSHVDVQGCREESCLPRPTNETLSRAQLVSEADGCYLDRYILVHIYACRLHNPYIHTGSH